TPFGELKFAPASDDPNPLTGWRPLRLLFQHAQSVRERGNAIPAKFQIVAKAAANNMHVGIVQAGNHAPTFEVNDLRVRTAFVRFRVVHTDDATVLDGDVRCFRIFRIECRNTAVVENEGGSGSCFHRILSFVRDCGCSQPCKSRVTTGITAQDRSATTKALKTALRGTNGHSLMTGPRVRFKIIASGRTPMNVATAIFHLGGGLPGDRNHASSPCSWRYSGSPSVSVRARSSHALNIGDS